MYCICGYNLDGGWGQKELIENKADTSDCKEHVRSKSNKTLAKKGMPFGGSKQGVTRGPILNVFSNGSSRTSSLKGHNNKSKSVIRKRRNTKQGCLSLSNSTPDCSNRNYNDIF